MRQIEAVCSDLKVRGHEDKVSRPEVSLVTERMDKLERLIDSRLGDVLSAITSVKQEMHEQNSSVKEIKSRNQTVTRSNEDLTKLSQANVSEDVESNSSEIITNTGPESDDNFETTSNEVQEKRETTLAPTVPDKTDPVSEESSTAQSPPLPSTSGQQQTTLDVMDNVTSNVVAMTTMMKTQEKQLKTLEKKLRRQGQATIDQMISEFQITRDIIGKTKKRRDSHICDFHVCEFSEWEDSGRPIFSRLWYLDRLRSHVKGCAHFLTDGTMTVGLCYGCHPNVTGREARDVGRLQVKVKVIPQGAGGECWPLGQTTWAADEKTVHDFNDGWNNLGGKQISQVSCRELRRRDLVVYNKIILRFEITCL